MTSNKPYISFTQGIEAFIGPAKCLSDIVQSWNEYIKITEEQQTKRYEIGVWEASTLAEIKLKHDVLIGYLDRSFDERTKNFQSLFQAVDNAILSGDNQQLGLTLQAIVELAKSSPFKDLADLSTVKAALNDPDHQWKF